MLTFLSLPRGSADGHFVVHVLNKKYSDWIQVKNTYYKMGVNCKLVSWPQQAREAFSRNKLIRTENPVKTQVYT